MRLRGKAGLITAAGSGMGRAGAIRFAQEGAAVAVVDRDEQAAMHVVRTITDAGGRAIALGGDLREDGFARAIVERTEEAFGALDFVWNHVGHPGPSLVEGLDMAEFDLTMDLNLRSVFVTSEAAIPKLRQSGKGSILFTASTSGLTASPGSPLYSAAKFAVVGLARALAKRLAPEGIRVNVVCPGPIDTPMLRTFVARPDQPQPDDIEAVVKARGSLTPMGRAGRPEEIANVALFLISDEASFVTGVALPVDGGATA